MSTTQAAVHVPIDLRRGIRRAGLPLLYGVFAAGVLVLSATTDGFMTVANFKAILSSTAFVGILAIGMTVIMTSGSLVSLSLGTAAAVCAMFFVNALTLGVGVAILATLVFGFVVGAAQGLAIGGLGGNPIIVTIAAGALQEGVTVWISGGRTVNPPNSAYDWLNATPLGIPLSVFVLVGFAVIVQAWLRGTRNGRELVLTGDSPRAAHAAGLSATRVGLAAFGLAGAAAAIAGMLLGAFNEGASLLLTSTLTFDAIAATLVAGTAVGGGRGSALNTLAGAVAIAALSDALLLRGLDTGWQILVKGALVTVVVILIHLHSMGQRT